MNLPDDPTHQPGAINPNAKLASSPDAPTAPSEAPDDPGLAFFAAMVPPSGPAESAARDAEQDEDAFNDWNRDITDYVPSLWDAYCFGLNRGRRLAQLEKERAK